MKKFLVAGIAALAFWGVPALAADMPMKAAPAPMWNWTGFYIGAEGGYGSGITMHVNQVTGIGSGAARVNGAIAGGTYGYNVQSGMWVYGLEGDFSWSGIKSTFFSVNGFCGAAPAQGCLTDQRWLGTDRGRVGYLFTPNNLIYATGGVAYGNVKAGIDPTICPTCTIATKTMVGWTAGAGIEGRLATPGWTLKLEYLYVDLGGKNIYTAAGGVDPERVSLRENIVRLGLNYKFGG
jgi:outer membrane immunogenic protein